MQLLIQTTAPDYAAWKTAFDAERENLDAAGLSPLQIWQGDAGRIVVLFEVHNRIRARDWLDTQSAFGRVYDVQFLRTV